MKHQRTYKGLTARKIIGMERGQTNAGDRVSGNIVWNYRTSYNPDGTLQGMGQATVCKPGQADCIGIETEVGTVAVLDI